MADVSAVAAKALAEGIQNVLKDEAILSNWLSRSQDLVHRVTQAMRFNGYSTRDIVIAAASRASQQFQIDDAFHKINNLFNQVQSAIDSADHSSGEVDRLQAAVEKTEQDIAASLEAIYQKYYKKYNALLEAENGILTTFNNDDMTKLLSEGYSFLNEIGETVRNTTIIYQVQLEFDGAGNHKTGFFTLDQLMPYLKASTYTLENGKQYSTLRFDEAKLKKDIANGTLQTLQWTKQREADYAQYIKVLRFNERTSTSKENAVWKSNIPRTNDEDIYINEGNAMESFQMMAANIVEQTRLKKILGGDRAEIHYSLHTVLENTVPYWEDSDFKGSVTRLLQGLTGDANVKASIKSLLQSVAHNGRVDIQEKLINATFTSLNSLFTQLVDAQSLLRAIQSSQISSDKVSGATDFLNPAVKTALEQFVAKFLPSG